MRISYVVHQFLPRYFTGTEQYCFAVARTFAEHGHDVEVFSLEPDFSERMPLWELQRETVAGLPVVRLRCWMHLDRSYDRMEFDHPFVAERFRRYLEERQPDVVHVFHLRYLGAALLHECRAARVRTVVHLMDFWFLCPAVTLLHRDGSLCGGPPQGGLGCVPCHDPETAAELAARGLDATVARTAPLLPDGVARDRGAAARAARLVERPRALRAALATATHVVAPSRFLRDTFVRNGYADDRVTVVRYGIDLEELAPVAAARAPRPNGAPLRCGFIGSIAWHKGTDIAVAAVLEAGAAVTLDVFGRTTDFPDFADPLVRRAAREPRIRFRGAFDRSRLPAVLADIDVLIVASRWYENTPFVALEALAAGAPVLASDVGGLAEIVRHEIDGELFPRGDSADLARRLVRLAAEPERLARYRAARPAVRSLADNCREIEALYAASGSGP